MIFNGSRRRQGRRKPETHRYHKVKDATYKALVDRFGEQDTLHLAVLVGHYLLVAQVLMTVDVELGEGMVAEIPD